MKNSKYKTLTLLAAIIMTLSFANLVLRHDIVCRIITVDGEFHEHEFRFIKKLCEILHMFDTKQDLLLQYVTELANNNKKWIDLTGSK